MRGESEKGRTGREEQGREGQFGFLRLPACGPHHIIRKDSPIRIRI